MQQIYYSAIISAPDTPRVEVYNTLVKAFGQFVAEKYNVKNGSSVCMDMGIGAKGEEQAEKILKTYLDSQAAVPTGWRYNQPLAPTDKPGAADDTSGPAGHDGVTSSADISGTSTPYYCYLQYIFPGEHQQTTYTTGVFQTTQSRNWTMFWWSNYIHSTYNIPQRVANITVTCDPLGPNPAQQQATVANNISSWKLHNEKVVQLNWQPTQMPPAGVSSPAGMELVNGKVVQAPPIGTYTQQGNPAGSYALCFENTGAKNYVTAIFDASKGEKTAWEVAFPKYLAKKFGPQTGNSGCMVYGSQAAAQHTLEGWKQQQSQAHKVVETSWTPDEQPTSTAASASNAAGGGSGSQGNQGSGQYVLCYSDVGQSPVYLSADIHISVPLEPGAQSGQSDGGASVRARDELKAAFLTYIKKQYGYHSSSAYPAYCDGAAAAADLAPRREVLHSRFHQMTFVETSWKPGMSSTVDKSAAAAKPATPPPSAAQTAYEKALEAQRPKGTTPPSQSSVAEDTSGKTYSYCSTIGSLPHAPSAPARSNYYVSAVFAAGLASQAAPAFQKMLQTANPQVQIQTPTCTTPQPMAATQTHRNNEIAARRNNPYISTVEVNWKP